MPTSDPISTLQAIPGAYIQARVQRTGLTLSETLIREEAGDRGALNAIIHAWLPQARRAFELRRRQSAFKARSELRGYRCVMDYPVYGTQTSMVIPPQS